MKKARQEILLRAVYAVLATTWLLVLVQASRFGFTVVQTHRAEDDLQRAKEQCSSLSDWIEDVESFSGKGSLNLERELADRIPVELDVTAATEDLLSEMDRPDVEAFNLQVLESSPWNGPEIEGLSVMRSPFGMSFRCDYESLTAIASDLSSLDRLIAMRQVGMSRQADGSLMVSITLETLRRSPATGDFK